MKKPIAFILVLLLLGLASFLSRGLRPPTTNPLGTFSFGVMGDAPYDVLEEAVDRPLGLANLTRLEVPGSPNVGWVRVTVTPNARDPFAFEPHVIPRWKLW